MRVAIVAGPHVAVPPEQYGGIEQVIHYLIKGLVAAGHEPILIGTADSTVNCELIPITDRAIGFPATAKDVPAFNQRVARVDRLIASELRKLLPRIDIIHAHGYDIEAFSNFPHLITLHCKLELADIAYFAQRRDLNYVSVSKNQQPLLPDIRFLGNVYNGEDPLDFPFIAKPEPYVCFLGRFDSDKNPHLAIQLAIAKGIKIKLGGKIDYRGDSYFEREIAPYLDHPLVEYLGQLNFKQKVELLSKAACNLHPVDFLEPFGLTVLEAAYCGTPTLAIRRGSMSELIENERTGMLVEDFVEGFHCLEKCFAMDRQYVSTRARLLFNYQLMTQQYLEMYAKVLENFEIEQQRQQLIKTIQHDKLSKHSKTAASPKPLLSPSAMTAQQLHNNSLQTP